MGSDNKKYNIMIVNVSLFRKTENTKDIIYTHKKIDGVDSTTVVGQQTNEAAIKYIFKKLKSENSKLDKIILLETNEVANDFISKNESITTNDYLSDVIKAESADTEIVQIILGKSKVSTLNEITSNLKIENESDNINIYIDSTGGARDYSDYIKMVINFLKYSGYKLADVIYSSLNTKEKTGNVNLINDNILSLINGAEEFTSTGRCDILYKILHTKYANEEIKKLIEAMKDFSDNMFMCQVNKIESTVENLKEKISNAEKISETEKNNSSSLTDEEALFINLIPQIKKKLYLDGEVNTPSIIRWCAENNLIQQALTIYESKIPQFIIEKKNSENENIFLKISDKDKEELHKQYPKGCLNDEFTWMFYTKFIDERTTYGHEYSEENSDSNEEKLLKELNNALNSNFKSKYTIKNKSQHNKKIDEIIDALDFIRNNSVGKNYQKSLNSIKTNKDSTLEKILKIIKGEGWKSFENTVNGLSNNIKYQRDLLQLNKKDDDNKSKLEDNIQKRINMICIKWIKENEKTKINPQVSNNEIQQILLDYAFIKQIRNTLNHASDVEEKNLEFFRRKGNPFIDEKYLTLNIENIREFIINALDYIESFCR